MGLLDDAIRDHLELKRRRGADPGEVAREQQEVLEPGVQAGAPATPQPAGEAAGVGYAPEEQELLEGAATVAQETQELDMESVLAREELAGQVPPEDVSSPARDAPTWAEEPEDELEVPREIPGQERLSFE